MSKRGPRPDRAANRRFSPTRASLAVLGSLLILASCGRPDNSQDNSPAAQGAQETSPEANRKVDLGTAIAMQKILGAELQGGYELTESKVFISDIPEEPATAGVVEIAAFALSGPPGPYNTIFLFYNIFVDPEKADRYVMQYISARDGSPTDFRTVPFRNTGHPELPQIGSGEDIRITCAAEPQGDLTAKCGFLASGPHPVVVTMVLAPGPTAGIREPGESPIAAAFRDGELVNRLNAVLPAVIDQLRSVL